MTSIKLPRKPKDTSKCLSSVSSYLEKEWDYTLNSSTPDEVSYGSIYNVWWVCSVCGYSWQTSINNRFLKGSGCPKCYNNSRSKDQRLTIAFVKNEQH